MRKLYVATIQVAVEVDTPNEACDAISEMMRNAGFCEYDDSIYDWQYLKMGGQQLLPTEKYINEDYEEGGAFVG